ncbi:MAG TPA: metallophosphoesterase [Fluviicoccus sp.]|nr:metallophosphoesterase [Fluviicoccus sp.]
MGRLEKVGRWWPESLIGLAVLVLGLAGIHDGFQAWSDMRGEAVFRGILLYESWLMPVLLCWIFRGLRRGWLSRGMAVVLAALMLLGIYARFVEPNLLVTRYTRIHTGYDLRLALISDLHYGQFSNAFQMRQLVRRLNELDVDAVVVAGDWTFDPRSGVDMAQLLAAFRSVRHPIYSVPGNHDEEQPGPPLQKALRAALIRNGVVPVEGRSVNLGPVQLVGLYELWSCQNGFGLPRSFQVQDRPVLLLAHHPDASKGLKHLPEGSLMMAGHTHGGQVYLPFVTDWLLKATHFPDLRNGLYRKGNLQVFITSGVGMIGLPLRFAVPPVIDVLELY